MKTCPHCNAEIRIRELPHPSLMANYRICPACNSAFTLDPETKRRQAVFIAILIVSLILTLAVYFDGTRWLIPALISYAALIAIGYWGNQKLFFVPYDNGRDSVADSQPGEQEKR